MENLNELNSHELKNLKGGGPILESIAWLYGFALGAHIRAASTMEWDDVDWDKQQVLVGG